MPRKFEGGGYQLRTNSPSAASMSNSYVQNFKLVHDQSPYQEPANFPVFFRDPGRLSTSNILNEAVFGPTCRFGAFFEDCNDTRNI